MAGYSFPETDSFMTRLLAEGIKRNDNLEHVFIINNSADRGWLNHVRNVFTKSWMANSVSLIHGTFRDAMGVLDGCNEQCLVKFDLKGQRALLSLFSLTWGRAPSFNQKFRIENPGLG